MSGFTVESNLNLWALSAMGQKGGYWVGKRLAAELSSEVQRLGTRQPEEGWETRGGVAAELGSEVQRLFLEQPEEGCEY